MTARDERRIEMFNEHIKSAWDAWIERLGLEHWRITGDVAASIDDHPDARAICNVYKQQGHRARITFTEDIFDEDESGCEIIVIHELLHIPLDELAEFAERHLLDSERDWFVRLLETFVADMANRLYDLVHPG